MITQLQSQELAMNIAPPTTIGTLLPVQRSIIAVDIVGSTARNNVQKRQLRADMYELFERALDHSGITEGLRDQFIDRGDGVMVFVHPADEIPKPLLVNRFVPTLRQLLLAHDADRQFRLRVSMHAGDVHMDRRGQYGEDLDLVNRLLDAPEFKAWFARTSEPLALVVSERIYRSVIWHGYEGIDAAAFKELVQVQVGATIHSGWIHVSS